MLKAKWVKLINRKSAENTARWEPQASSVVCSKHFVDGKPTEEHPFPSLHMGYDICQTLGTSALKRVRKMPTKHQQSLKVDKQLEEQPSTSSEKDCAEPSFSIVETKPKIAHNDIIEVPTVEVGQGCQPEELTNPENPKFDTFRKLQTLQAKYFTRVLQLKAKTTQLKLFLKPLHKKLLTRDGDVNFYTGIPNIRTFTAVCNYYGEFVKQRQRRRATFSFSAKYRQAPIQKRKVKMSIEDRVLLTLMKLRLGLLHKDLADRY